MTLKQFQDNDNFSPVDKQEFAERIMDIEDCPELVRVAEEYLEAQTAFNDMLENYGLELG